MCMIIGPCHIELFVGNAALEEWRSLVEQAGHQVTVRALHESGQPAQLCIIDSGPQAEAALKLCRRLRGDQADSYTPILFVGDAGTRLAALENGADVALERPASSAELIAQVQTLL